MEPDATERQEKLPKSNRWWQIEIVVWVIWLGVCLVVTALLFGVLAWTCTGDLCYGFGVPWIQAAFSLVVLLICPVTLVLLMNSIAKNSGKKLSERRKGNDDKK